MTTPSPHRLASLPPNRGGGKRVFTGCGASRPGLRLANRLTGLPSRLWRLANRLTGLPSRLWRLANRLAGFPPRLLFRNALDDQNVPNARIEPYRRPRRTRLHRRRRLYAKTGLQIASFFLHRWLAGWPLLPRTGTESSQNHGRFHRNPNRRLQNAIPIPQNRDQNPPLALRKQIDPITAQHEGLPIFRIENRFLVQQYATGQIQIALQHLCNLLQLRRHIALRCRASEPNSQQIGTNVRNRQQKERKRDRDKKKQFSFHRISPVSWFETMARISRMPSSVSGSKLSGSSMISPDATSSQIAHNRTVSVDSSEMTEEPMISVS